MQITAVEGGGIEVCETELIESVNESSIHNTIHTILETLPADYVETNSETQEEIKDTTKSARIQLKQRQG